MFNTFSSILSCCQQDDWQGTRSNVSLEIAAQLPLSCPRLFAMLAQGTLQAPPSCPLLQPEGESCWVLSCCCDFTFDPFSAHSSFPLGKHLFIPPDPDPTPLLGKAFLAPHLLNQDSIVLPAPLLNLSLRVHSRAQHPGRPQWSERGHMALKTLSSFPQKHFSWL